MNPVVFTTTEWVAWGCNTLLCLGILVRCYWNKDRVLFWSPPMFMAAIYLYYVILGPLIAREMGNVSDRGVDMRAYYIPAWIGAFTALASWLVGYAVRGKGRTGQRPFEPTTPVGLSELWRLSTALNFIGLLSFAITAGFEAVGYVNPLMRGQNLSGGIYTGAFANYLALSVNFLVPGCAILFLLRLKGYGSWWSLALWIVSAAGIYTSIGFRYRLVLLGGALMFVYYLHKRRRPNLLLFGPMVALFVMSMGLVGATRNYGTGLDLAQREASWTDTFLSGFGEASIFATSGAVITVVPGERPLVGLEPIKQALIMPIPSILYSGKATDAYMVDTLISIYGPLNYFGGAYMFFAECYQAFWWPGIVVVHFVLGWLCRWLWEWYRLRDSDPLVLLVYASAIPYLYVVISRGYLPQTVMLFFFSVGPAIALYRWPKRIVSWAPTFGVRSLAPIQSKQQGSTIA